MKRFVGIDIGSEKHFFAVVDSEGRVTRKAASFSEDDAGYTKLREALGAPADTLVAMEATGHYWQNLYAVLAAMGFLVAVLNPLRTRRFAEVDLKRAKTDAIDAVGIARFAQEKRPLSMPLPDEAGSELRELVRHRDRLVQDLGDRVRQLHRILDLGFPEITRFLRELSGPLATTIIQAFPTARAFAATTIEALAAMKYDGEHRVGIELATNLVETAKKSVGQHHGAAYQLQARHSCEDIDVLRSRIKALDGDISSAVQKHEVAKLLTSISGIGDTTASRLVAELGDITAFESADALAAYVGVVPGTHHSGKSTPSRQSITRIGHAGLRAKLYMPTLTATRYNPWLRAFYERLCAKGKLPKVALVAAMRKLLHAVYSVAKSRRAFVPRLPAVDAAPAPS